MVQIDYKYLILDCDEVIFESTAQVKLTQKDIKETEKFIKEHNYSPEFVDIPGKVHEKCMEKAFQKAVTEYPQFSDRYEELDVILEQYIPICLINLLSDEVRSKMLSEDPYYLDQSKIHHLEEDNTNNKDSGIERGCNTGTNEKTVINNDESTRSLETVNKQNGEDSGMEDVNEIDGNKQSIEPSKENTLYLPIKQIYFDAIVEGSKKEEYREIKPTTYKKYLECDENGYPYFDDELIDIDNPLCDDINVWNDGVYPLIPNDRHKYLHLAVGYKKVRDEALIEIANVSFEPLSDENGKAFRFDEENGKSFRSESGKLCFWNIVYHLGQILKVQRVSKMTSNKKTNR